MPLPPNDCILVIHTAFIGDLVLSTSFFSALRQRHPQAKILFVTTPAGAEIFSPNPWNLEFVVYDKRKRDAGLGGFWRLAQRLRQERPTLSYCLHRSARSSLLARLAGGEITGFAEGVGSWLFRHCVSRQGIPFEVEKNLALLGVSETIFPHLEVARAAADSIQKRTERWGKYLVLSPSSVWATKRWPAAAYGELARRVVEELRLTVVLVGANSAEDKAISATVAQAAPGGVIDVTGSTSLGELKAIIAGAELVVTNDSSPLHIALALGKKAVAIFGPTTKELGFFPYAPSGQSAVVEHPSLACRPCGLHGHRVCPQQHFRCMLEIPVSAVYAEVKKLCP
jgi:heptosyltransferase-2